MDYLDDILKTIASLGPEAFTIPRILPITNKVIPWVCICLAPFVYPMLTNPGRVAPDVKYPLAREIATGFLLGLLAWIAHDKAIKHFERWLVGRFGSNGSKRYRRTAQGGFEEVRAELETPPTVDKP